MTAAQENYFSILIRRQRQSSVIWRGHQVQHRQNVQHYAQAHPVDDVGYIAVSFDPAIFGTEDRLLGYAHHSCCTGQAEHEQSESSMERHVKHANSKWGVWKQVNDQTQKKLQSVTGRQSKPDPAVQWVQVRNRFPIMEIENRHQTKARHGEYGQMQNCVA